MKNKFIITIIIITFFIKNPIFCQQIGLGGSVLYNLQTESFAGSLRADIPYKRISLVPQITFYPGFNKISEYYISVAAHLDFMGTSKWKMYLIGMLGYNRWSNYDKMPNLSKKPNNWDGEIGLGWTTRKCLRPFVEYRYNFKWKETNLGIGLIYTLHCKNAKRRGSINCPGH